MIRAGMIWSGIAILIMAAISFYGNSAIADGAQVPVHWGMSGEPDRFASKAFALWLMPSIGVLISLVFMVVPIIEPRRRHLLDSSRLFLTAWAGTMAIMTLAHAVTIFVGAGFDLPVAPVVLAAVSLLLVVIGNVLGKSRSSFFLGIRTPWTLTSEQSWEKTHRLAGRLWVVGGLLAAAVVWLVDLDYAIWAFIAVVAIITLVPVAASYFYWKADPARETGER